MVRLVKLNPALAVDMYRSGKTTDQIATYFGVTRGAVNKALRKNNIPIIRQTRFSRYAEMSAEAASSLERHPKKYHTPEIMAARVAIREAELAAALARCIPDRSPCPYCGVRADFGCRHNRMAA